MGRAGFVISPLLTDWVDYLCNFRLRYEGGREVKDSHQLVTAINFIVDFLKLEPKG